MRALIAVVVVALLSPGCTSTRIVGSDGASSQHGQLDYREAQNVLRGEKVRVILADGQHVDGSIAGITADSVTIRRESDASLALLATDSVQRMARVDRVGGGLLGFLGGTFGGMLVGVGVGEIATPYSDGWRGLGVAMYGLGGAMYGLGGACLGMIAGTAYGASHGVVQVYEFRHDSVHMGTP
jgi:hypothetical protein